MGSCKECAGTGESWQECLATLQQERWFWHDERDAIGHTTLYCQASYEGNTEEEKSEYDEVRAETSGKRGSEINELQAKIYEKFEVVIDRLKEILKQCQYCEGRGWLKPQGYECMHCDGTCFTDKFNDNITKTWKYSFCPDQESL